MISDIYKVYFPNKGPQRAYNDHIQEKEILKNIIDYTSTYCTHKEIQTVHKEIKKKNIN